MNSGTLDDSSVRTLLKEINRNFVELDRRIGQLSFSNAYNQVVSQMHALTAASFNAQQEGLSVKSIRAELSNCWEIFSKSTFVQHLQRWPRGYPGDFEAINMIIDRYEAASPGTIGGIIGNYSLNTTIAQQHREKISIQAGMIRHYCRNVKQPRIVSIACGASRDMEMVLADITDSQASIVLSDFDQAALDESAQRLVAIREQLTYQLINVRRIPKLLAEGSGFHLIYAGGLFDYLPDGVIITILKHAGRNILPGGCLMFTNAADNSMYHSYRPLIETMADWRLIDRSKEEMERLISACGCVTQSLELEPTGLMWIAKGYF